MGADGSQRRSRAGEVAWLALVLVTWALIAYLAMHRSADATVLGRYSPGYLAILVVLVLTAAAMGGMLVGPFRERTAGVRANVLAIAAGSVAALVVAEAVVRVADPIGISYYEHARAYHGDKIADATRGFRHRPGLRATYGRTDVSINEIGLRDDPIAPKADGEYRIVAVGDSVTFGWGVPRADTFTEQLERDLARRLGRPVTVINGGVGGYNSVQELAFLREDGLRLSPDLVLLVYVYNDVDRFVGPARPDEDLSLAGKPPLQAMQLLLGRLWSYRFAKHVLTYGGALKWSVVGGSPVPTPTELQESMNAVSAMVDAASQAGVPTLVLYFRWTVASSPFLVDAVRAASAPAPVIDSAAWFAGHDVRELINSRVDSHANRKGNELLAQGVASYIVDNGLSAR
jgi:lysophospholipase L1-like esterase